MKRLHTGLILLDGLDIICISFSAGSLIAISIRKYRKYKERKYEDPIVAELKRKSELIIFSKNNKPLKLPLVRGGENIKAISLMIQSKNLALLIRAMFYARKKHKRLKLLQLCFFALNTILTTSVGLRFAVGGSLNYTQFILLAFPSTLGGLIRGFVLANPLASVLLPLAILSGRGIENIPDLYEKCRILCEVAEQYHNKQIMLEMQKLVPLTDDTLTMLGAPLTCVEEKLSLLERFKLRTLIKNAQTRPRIQHFSEFIKKFPECEPDPSIIYEKITE